VTFLAGVVGLVLALAAHDLAIQALDDDRALRPFTGVCPRCGNHRGWLRLRCDRCGRRVNREPIVALLAGFAAAGFANTVGPSWVLLAYLGFLLVSTALLVSDIHAFRIVDRLNLRGTAVLVAALVLTALADGAAQALFRSMLGAAAYFAGAFLVFLVVRGRGFGAGDVKLAPQLGLFTAYLSWGTLGWAAFTTAILGGVFAAVMLLVGRAGMKSELPYGPPMIIGAWISIALAGLVPPG
jgi:leader peptidase (prepilin peptidase)/N-methyltransferase